MPKKFSRVVMQGATLVLLCQGHADEESEYPFQSIKVGRSREKQMAHVEEAPTEPSYTQEKQTGCTSAFRNLKAGVRHNEARGIGYKEGYSTLEVFGISDYFGNRFLPFFDVRGHVFNNGRLAGNVGVGGRSLLSGIQHFLGAYLYYDVRDESSLTVHQLSPGMELLGSRMEYRINGYFPVGKKQSAYHHPEFDKFKHHNLYIKRKQKRALSGVDAEVGGHITQQTKYDVYAGAGPYYLYDAPGSAWGGKARVTGSYKQYVTLEIMSSYDRLFKTTLQGSVAVNIPFGHKRLKKSGNNCLLLARAVDSPSRLEIPMIRKHTKSEVAINPGTGEPWQFWFVDNLSSSLGTYESPFPLLAQAQNASSAGDIIYVFPGDGTTLGMNAGITLKNNQKLFGSGVKQTLATTRGSISIPAQSKAMPLITNTATNVVTLANNNEVSGVYLTSGVAGSSLIFGLSFSNTSIHNNTFVSTASAGAPQGILLTGSGNIFIANNHMQGRAVGGSSVGVSTNGTANSQLNLTMTENTIVGFDTAIGNSIKSGNVFTVDIGNNRFSSNGVDACIVTFATLAGSSRTLLGRIHDNICDNRKADPGTFGIYFNITTQLNGCLTVENNQVFGTATNGLFLDSNGGGSFSTIVTNNILSNSGPALFTTTGAGTTLCLRLLNNQSPTGYQVTNTAGTINLEPPVGNTGTITTSGVTFVPENTCCP